MAGIRGRDTKPEISIRRALHALGFRYRLHARDIFGKPDVVLPKHRALIMLHGCFWHGHGCRFSKLPATNTEFWHQKITKNRLRDEQVLETLLAEGWRCFVVWECAIRACKNEADASWLAKEVAMWINGEATIGGIDEAIVAARQSKWGTAVST